MLPRAGGCRCEGWHPWASGCAQVAEGRGGGQVGDSVVFMWGGGPGSSRHRQVLPGGVSQVALPARQDHNPQWPGCACCHVGSSTLQSASPVTCAPLCRQALSSLMVCLVVAAHVS